MIEWLIERYRRRRVRKFCFHHDMRTGSSFIDQRLIETGKAKMFWCTECGKTWIL